MSKKSTYLVGVFDDDEVLIKAVDKIRALGVKIHDVFTPFAVHDLDVHLGYPRTRLGKVAFLFGITGTTLAILMQTSMLGFLWPMNIGGKDYLAYPDFVPVSFEATVLIASLGMVATFLVSNGLGPGKNAKIFDSRSTDDKFVMAIDLSRNEKFTQDQLIQILEESGVSEKPYEKEL